METNKIKFISNRAWLKEDNPYKPVSIVKTIPAWFREADRFAKNPINGEYWIGPDKGKIPTWKACPALLDVMSTGYTLLTPCDLEFFVNDKGHIDVRTDDKTQKNFCGTRPPMPQFEHPNGYYKHHFSWFPEWSIKLPDGYSMIYTNPMNRNELPFMTTSGIIDNDKVNLPGTMPFFLRDGWTGIVPAGTPYVQMIPFKRENWESEYEFPTSQKIAKDTLENRNKYRVPNGGVYKNFVWTKRTYN